MSISLSEDQQVVYDKLFTYLRSPANNKEFRLGGLAGTGKSTLLSKFIQENRLFDTVAVATFTGKAAERLLQTNLAKYAQVSTLHKLLYAPEFDEDTHEFLGFKLRPSIEPIVFIDEASMVPLEYYEILMGYLNHPRGGLKKLVFVGDHGQLPPVDASASKVPGAQPFNVVAEDLLDAKLEKIHRQAQGSPIIQLAHNIRNARTFQDIQEVVRQAPIAKVSEEDAFKGAIHYARQDSWHNVVNIVFKNTTRCAVNERFITMYGASKLGLPVIGLQNKSRKRSGKQVVAAGPSLAQLPSDDSVFIANGSRGLITEEPRLQKAVVTPWIDVVHIPEVDFSGIGAVKALDTWKHVWNDPKAKITYDRRTASILYMDWAFAITCHKSQGSSWKVVLVWLNDLGTVRDIDFLKKWLYTAVTRTEERLAFVC